MAILSKGQTFADADAVTSTKLNNLVDNAAFVTGSSGSTDDSSLEVNGSGRLQVKDGGISAAKLGAGVITNAKLADSTSAITGVTYSKIQYVANMKALGNTTGALAAPSEVSIFDEDDMVSDSATSLATQQSIKAYVDTTVTAAKVTPGTAVATTSGTSIDLTGLPSTVQRLFVILNGVSSNGTNDIGLQLGDSGGFETTGYDGAVSWDAGRTSFTSYYQLTEGLSSSSTCYGIVSLVKVSGTTWIATSNMSRGDNSYVFSMAGSKTLSGTLTQVRLMLTGANTFDAGEVNIYYE